MTASLGHRVFSLLRSFCDINGHLGRKFVNSGRISALAGSSSSDGYGELGDDYDNGSDIDGDYEGHYGNNDNSSNSNRPFPSREGKVRKNYVKY